MNEVHVHAQAPTPPAVKPILDEPVKGVTPTDAHNLSAARPASLDEEATVFMTTLEVEAY